MFESFENNRKMILGAYRKLKSYYYYDKTILYNKISLAMWESDSHSLESRVNRLAEFMCTLEGGVDYNYLTPLMRSIVLVPMPKSFEEPQTEDDGILIQNAVPQNSLLSKVNFYIKAPVELLILDAIWMLMIGKIAYQQPSISSCAYANRPKVDQLYNGDDSLYSGIDFDSNRLFVPYFKQYTAWRNNAFKKVKSRYKNQQDSVLISLDLRSYYYSVTFDFENLPRYLNNDSRLAEIAPLTKIIHQIYIDYTSEMKKFRGAIPADCQKGQCALPIGLHSSMLLANLYLYELDKAISEQVSPIYYGRYVDDILIVIDKPHGSEMTVTSILHKTLVKCGIIEPKDSKEYNVLIPNTAPHFLTLQSEKIRCIYFDHNEPDALIKLLCEASNIKASISEGTLMPDIGFSERSFDEQAYSLGERAGAFKVRSFLFSSNNYEATLFINDFYHREVADTWMIDFEDKPITVSLSFGDILRRGAASDLKLHPKLTVEFEKTSDVQYVYRVYSSIVRFLRLIRYDTKCGKLQINLFAREQEKVSYNGFLRNFSIDQGLFCKGNHEVEYGCYKPYIQRFLQFAADNPKYTFFHYPTEGLRYRGGHYSAIDYMNIFSAFEAECHANEDLYENVDATKVQAIKEALVDKFDEYPKDGLKQEEIIFLDNARNRILQLGTQFGQTQKIINAYQVLHDALDGSIENIFYLPEFKLEGPLQMKDLKKIAGFLTKQRGVVAHGGFSGVFSDEDAQKIHFLEILTYAQTLKRIGLGDADIERVIGVVFGCNCIFFQEKYQ